MISLGRTDFYVYRTTFDLTGLDPNTAKITGQWSTDDLGGDILINGVSTGQSITVPNAFTQFFSFSVLSGFIAGINTLDFLVVNTPCGSCDGVNPTALRVEMTGTAATPLPAALPLFASGLGALGLLGWRRKRKKMA